MIYVFKSKASADVIMLPDHAKALFALLGRQLDDRGIIPVEQVAGVRVKLEAAIAAEKAQQLQYDDEKSKEDQDGETSSQQKSEHVQLSQRAFPFLEMLRAAEKSGKEVVWGV